MQPFYTTRGVSRAPFFIIRGEAATTTLGPKGRQPSRPQGVSTGEAPSTLTPQACPYPPTWEPAAWKTGSMTENTMRAVTAPVKRRREGSRMARKRRILRSVSWVRISSA